jgi:hypothetical protein
MVNQLVRLVQMAYRPGMDQEPKDVRLPIMVTATEAKAIDDWRFDKRIPTRAEAIRQLIALGLKSKE